MITHLEPRKPHRTLSQTHLVVVWYEGYCGCCHREIGTGHTRWCWYHQRRR